MLFLCIPQGHCQAHFPWLKITKTENKSTQLECYFSEKPHPDDPKFLKYLQDANVVLINSNGVKQKVTLTKSEKSLNYKLNEDNRNHLVALTCNLGVMSRAGTSFLIKDYAYTGPGLSSFAWRGLPKHIPQGLTVVPQFSSGKLKLSIQFNGKPASRAEVLIYPVDHDTVKIISDEKGKITWDIKEHKTKAVRVTYVEDKAGTKGDEAYTEIRHYATLTFPTIQYKLLSTAKTLTTIPETVTSFGACVEGDILYYYGGHTGDAHSYSQTGQARTLWSLNLKQKNATWKSLE